MPLPERSSRMNVAPPEVPTPRMAGGGKEKAIPEVTCERPGEMQLDGVVTHVRRLALVPRLERHEEEGTVRGLDAAKQAVAHDGADVRTPGVSSMIFSTSRAASEVRCNEEASGS